MIISVAVCNDTGWHIATDVCPDGSDLECHALPKTASRHEFWRSRIRQTIPDGHVLIWETITIDALRRQGSGA